jgi:hypothetical protein
MQRVFLLATVAAGLLAAAGCAHRGATPVRPCRAKELTARLVPNGATGSIVLAVTFSKDGPPCTLRGYPKVALLDRAGRPLADVETVRVPRLAGVKGPAVVGGRRRSLLFLQWREWCGRKLGPNPHDVRLSLRIELRRRGALAVPFRTAPPRCDEPGLRSTLAVAPFTQATQ